MMKPLRSFFAFLMLLATVGSLTNCTNLSTSEANRALTLAVVEDDFGTVSKPDPQSIYAGVKLAADQMNARGYDIKVVPYSDNNDVKLAKDIAAQIVATDAVAVIGHATIETSAAGAEVYDRSKIPAVGVIPFNAELTATHPYFFNVSYTAEMQAAYLANYLSKIEGQQTASVIFTTTTYSRTLAEKFSNSFRGLGGKVSFSEEVVQDPSDADLEQIVSKFVTADTETENPGAIFIATNEDTAIKLIVKMNEKGLAYPIVGADTITSPEFIQKMSEQSEERVQAGTLTDGILSTSSVIFDSASRFAHQLLQEYRDEYPQPETDSSINNNYNRSDPGNEVVNGYDAALAILSAAQRANLDATDVQANRELIFGALQNMDSPANGPQGIIGPLYFDPSRNIVSSARFGVYQNGQLVSAMTQFEPIDSPELLKRDDLKAQLENQHIITVNGKYVYVANVVYAGVDLIDIHDVDIKTSTYAMDFYLWFRYRANIEDPNFQPTAFVFTNAVSIDDNSMTPIREPETDEVTGITTVTYRVTGVFKNPFYFYEYPFDVQELSIQLRNKDATTSYIQYVVDRIGMQYLNEDALTKHFKDNGAFNNLAGWKVITSSAQESIFSTTSTLGNPQNFGRNTSTDFSLIDIGVEVKRDSLQFIIKSLLPLLFTLILAYITFFLPLGHSERLGVGSTALLTTAFFHLSLADALPQIGYTVAMEYLFYASYLMSAAIVFLETISIRAEKRSEAEKDEKIKEQLQKRREKLNMVGRIVYPSILAIVLIGGALVSLGLLNMVPKTDADAQSLIARVLDLKAQEQAMSASPNATSQTGEDKIVLTLLTWRPEDTENMKKLLAEFHAYALTQNKDIVVEYQSVIGANYDSVLSAQLAKGQAADLFYVRPHAVDGELSRYLVDISDLDIATKYDVNEGSVWQNDLDGKYYAMPYVGVVQGVYYNKDFFTQHGLAEPTNWQEFIELASTIKGLGKNPIANALNERQDSEMFQSILASFVGGPEGHARFAKTDGTSLCFTNYRVVTAFRAIESLRRFLLPDAGTMDDTKGKESFINEESMMLFGGSWDMQYFTEKAKFQWSVFAPPAPARLQTYIIFEPDAGIGINRSTKNKEAAKLFLEWLMADGAKASEKHLPGRYPLINKAGETTSVAAIGHDADFARLTTSYPSDIRWLFAETDSEYPRSSEIVRQALHDMITLKNYPNDEGGLVNRYLTAKEAAERLQTGLGEWYEPAQTCR